MTYEEYCKLRDSNGLTDYAVAKSANVSRSCLSQWKNGNTEPSRATQERLERFFSAYPSRRESGFSSPVLIETNMKAIDPSPTVAFYYIKLIDGSTVRLSSDEYSKLQEAIDAFTYAWIKNLRSGS